MFQQTATLERIEHLDQALESHYKDKFRLQPELSRSLVSFQANKSRAVYRWYKYKEAFSAALVEHLFNKYKVQSGHVLDPFAGSGTALFVASEHGIDADGIELLPIGQQIIATKKLLDAEFTGEDFKTLAYWGRSHPWRDIDARVTLPELRITLGAYPPETKKEIEQYLTAVMVENERVQAVLRFALLCVLEAISFTRKDGQYLRWDYRSTRRQGVKPFDKGEIQKFVLSISAKIDEIVSDLQSDLQKEGAQGSLFPMANLQGQITLIEGSCLEVMPTLPGSSYDALITSPPYCNRYDYTRTYALELALLGVDERGLSALRQQMLSCTVENRSKDLLNMNPGWSTAIAVADEQPLLQAILHYLDRQKEQGILNNNGIPRMVRGYFYEMACVIAECARVLKPEARLIMVNDNVRYAGASISVDMILSQMAEGLGFVVENILVLPNGKGNSSQQMGAHGRDVLRKCVYVWRKV